MKKLLLFFTTLLLFFNASAQDYLGLSTGNYSGIQGIGLQPASVADNRYKWELNLISTNIGFQNNYLGFSRDYFLKNRFSFKDFDTYNEFKSSVLKENAVTGNNVAFNLSNRLNLPSVMITTGPKSGIAIGLQSRTAIAVDNLNADFAKQAFENFQYSNTYNLNYDMSGLSMNALNWFEGSFTYGRVLLDNGKHFLKVGVTAKYLGGVSSWYLDAKDLNISVNSDSTISTNGNAIHYGHSPTNFSGQILKDYEPDASGSGFDAGIVYEFRGRINKFKLLNLNNDKESYMTTRRDKNKYSFKVGVSLLDAGKLTFNSTPLARDFSTNVNGVNIKNIGIQNVQDLDTFISNNVNYLSAQMGQEFSVAMPTALSAQFDLHLVKGFYVNAMAYMPFNSLNKNVDYRVFTPNYYAVTPRWESRAAGLYVPIVYNNTNNEKKELTVGSTLRLGPLFVGTNNLLTLIKKDNVRSANVHVGFKLPFAHGKPSKAASLFKKFTNKSEMVIVEDDDKGVIIEKQNDEKIIEKEKPVVQPIQIIINNYNSAGKKLNNQRIIDIDPNAPDSILKSKIITNDNSDSNDEFDELRSMQQQIEYLKFKLKQKEELLYEIEKEQELLKQGTPTEESKKKIDALKNDYIYNNDYELNKTFKDSSNSVLDMRASMFELKKELIDLGIKNEKLENTFNQLLRQNNAEKENAVNEDYGKRLEEINMALVELKEKEKTVIQPTKVYYHNTPNYDYPNKGQLGNGSPQITQIPSASSNTKKTISNNWSSKVQEKQQQQYKELQDEVIMLRSELRTAQKAAKPKRNWVWFARKNSKVKQVEPEKIIVRDTIVLEKPVERIVTKIVRDTVTNTIEKNNIITKTETKVEKVEVDNTMDRLLAMPSYYVLFDVGSARVKQIYRKKLDYYSEQIAKYSSLKLRLTGHADASGNAQSNLALSKRRAQQVRNYLILKGVSREKISIDFNGDQDPLADNKTKVGKSQNRRVELLFVK